MIKQSCIPFTKTVVELLFGAICHAYYPSRYQRRGGGAHGTVAQCFREQLTGYSVDATVEKNFMISGSPVPDTSSKLTECTRLSFLRAMCNRYAQTKDSARIRLNTVGQREFSFKPRYNVSPTQQVDVVRVERGELVQSQMRWGWYHKTFGAITNAQAETAYQKMFKDAWKNRRCVVPADGFYEWKEGKPAQPYRIVMPTRKLFWFAGLWNEGEVLILTAPASSWLRSIHDRQPIVPPEKELDWWLGPADEQGHEGWAVIRRGVSMYAFEAYPVTPKMSNPRFESPECVEPVTPTCCGKRNTTATATSPVTQNG